MSGSFDHLLGGEYPKLGPSAADFGAFDSWLADELSGTSDYQASGVISVFDDLELQWDVAATISDDIEYIWNVEELTATPISDDLELIWDVAGSILDDLTLLYDTDGQPLYKTRPLTGTVSKDTGRTITAVMLRDE